MGLPTYKVAVLVGYQKAHVAGPRGQLINAALGSPLFPDQWMAIKAGEGEGVYLHGRTKKPMLWWVSEQWIAAGDLVKIETKVAEAGIGLDEQRTMDVIVALDPTAQLVEIRWPGLGYQDWPLLKGRVQVIYRSSPGMERKLQITAAYNEGHEGTQDGVDVGTANFAKAASE